VPEETAAGIIPNPHRVMSKRTSKGCGPMPSVDYHLKKDAIHQFMPSVSEPERRLRDAPVFPCRPPSHGRV